MTIIAETSNNKKSHLREPLVRNRLKLFVPPIALDRTFGIPLHRQIYRQIAEAIRSGAVDYEARLPSTRAMAGMLRVSRNTVLAAYEDLAAEDLVRGEHGSGMRITRRGNEKIFGLRQVIRAAGYPARVLELADPDGNPLYINS
jgi:DNA-binding transcriptional regulator YhcF (GntR family)